MQEDPGPLADPAEEVVGRREHELREAEVRAALEDAPAEEAPEARDPEQRKAQHLRTLLQRVTPLALLRLVNW